MDTSPRLQKLLVSSIDLAKKWRHEFVTPEHLLYVLTKDISFMESYSMCGGDIDVLKKKLRKYFKKNMEQIPEDDTTFAVALSNAYQSMLEYAAFQAESSGRVEITLPHVFFAMIKLPECYATFLIEEQEISANDVFFELCYIEEEREAGGPSGANGGPGMGAEGSPYSEDGADYGFDGNGNYGPFVNSGNGGKSGHAGKNYHGQDGYNEYYGEGYESGANPAFGGPRQGARPLNWGQYVTNLNDIVSSPDYTELIGREKEINETMLVLCRKDKNNPLHIGEPGVGKTAITYGLVKRIMDGNVPEQLKDATVYSVDMGSMVAGTQYRGDFEKRLKGVLDGIADTEKPIVYLDEIHNVIGAGATNGGALDAGNIIKPYLTTGKIRFIGATTYDEYKKHFEKSKSLVRRFQNIDVAEPSAEETVEILEGVKNYYENFHQVIYSKDIVKYIVTLSEKYINERFMPDKSLDLLDEAGAYISLKGYKDRNVTREIVEEVLAELLKIPKTNVTDDEAESLKNLDTDLLNRVYGQDEAVDSIARAIRISRAGLNEENKPVASLLFVGPTGVGKTELAKSLAESLGIELIRYDMSEYMEKHSVAKFIGAPAGYVGYEEGGQLTDAIRKKPHSVLLLDEIEKAHPDILNVLLQVMDYATLSDNQGRKADFRNVIIIMTSNAGAARLGKPAIGFGDSSMNLGAIDEEVKRIFTPEFRNRLTATITFNPMSESMGRKIVDKQLGILASHLSKKNVEITFSDELKNMVYNKGISTEFGARQIQRVIDQEIKTVLVDALLYGSLKNGGKAKADVVDGKVVVASEI